MQLANDVALLPTPDATHGRKTTRTGPLLPGAIALLPTPVVNDVGEGKTSERWDEWTAEMQERHGNGNGHGRSLAIEAMRLLPTPRTSDTNGPGSHGDGGMDLRTAVTTIPTPTARDAGASRNSTANRSPGAKPRHAGDTLTDWATLLGASTPPPSPDGSSSSDDPPLAPPTSKDDSTRPSSSGCKGSQKDGSTG